MAHLFLYHENKTFENLSFHVCCYHQEVWTSLTKAVHSLASRWPLLEFFTVFMQPNFEVLLFYIGMHCFLVTIYNLSQLMRLWYLSHRRPAKAQATSKGSGEPAHPCNLPRTFAVCHMKYGSRQGSNQKSDI